ncbi:MAG TPA: hypothetical protein PLP34_03000 [Chitinophagaceae bacterium]|nr:hypothetical protein [Chitinophagaceae bacterium]
MNKKIALRSGIITGFSIVTFLSFLNMPGIQKPEQLSLIQFILFFAGIFTSMYFLFRYYTGIRGIEAFLHGIKTASSALMIVLAGNLILFFIMQKGDVHFSEITLMIMKTIFAYSLCGVLWSLLSSLIFNTFTKNKQ